MKLIKKTRKYIYVKLTKEEYETLLNIETSSSQSTSKIKEDVSFKDSSLLSFSHFEGYGVSDW